MPRNRRSTTRCNCSATRWGILIACCLFVVAPRAAAEDPQPVANVEIGIEGCAKRGCWTQVRLSSDLPPGATMNGFDGEGFPLRTQVLSPNGVTYVKVGRQIGQMTVSKNANDPQAQAVQWSEPPQILSSLQQFVIVVGGDLGIEAAVKLRRRSDAEAIVAKNIRQPASLPVHPLGYDGVDVVMICTSDATWLADLSEEQLLALDRWVSGGGTLALCAGQSADQVFGESGKLRRFLPGTYAGASKQRETNGIEAFVKAGTAIKLRDEVGRINGIPTITLQDVQGRTLVEDGNGNETTPWLVHSAYGFGNVLLISADLDVGPFAEWKDRSRFVAKILDILLGKSAEEENERRGQVRHLGFTDLSGQLRASLDQFPGVWLVPFSLIAGLLAAYVLLLGPVDYVLLRYFGGHMHWTWVTFPLLVLGFGLLAGLLAQRVKSDSVQLNQVDLVDVDMGRGQIRTQTWAHLYSPVASEYSLQLTPAKSLEAELTDPGDAIFSWQGLPGGGFSGLEGQGAITPIVAPYENRLEQQADHLTCSLERVGVPARSTRSFAGNWMATKSFPPQEGLFQDRDGLLSGELTNPLPINLRDCAIVCGPWYYKLGSIKAEQTVAVNATSRPLNFNYRLMRRSVDQRGDRDYGDRSTPWDRASFDQGRIMEMMMFHKMAGGRLYTGLLNQFHGDLDLSDHLEMQVAIVFGRLAESASKVTIASSRADEPETQNNSFFRIVIPVNRK